MASASVRAALVSALVLILLPPVAAQAEIVSADLAAVRTVSERDWLQMRLEVLGLRLTYPAYRVHLELEDGAEGTSTAIVSFTFWLSAAMAEHLMDAGRTETERVLTYHGQGIEAQVRDLVREEFPDLWPHFRDIEDVAGRFLAPGEKVDEAPQQVARWAEGELTWTYSR